MEIKDKQISEIADRLDCGQVCFYHRPTGTIEHHPDPDSPFFEAELWKDIIDKIRNQREEYHRFEIMDSRQSFQVMRNFANSLDDSAIKSRLLAALSEHKPFANFRRVLDSSIYLNDWYKFKREAVIKWVRQQLK